MAVRSTVYGPNGFMRNLTDEDRIWAVRMLDGEEGTDPAKSVAWEATLYTMLNRWASCRYTCPDTYTDFIRRFSKAINPRWWPTYGMNPRLDHPIEWYLARHPEVVRIVDLFLRGRIRNRYVGWTNYGAPSDPGVASGSVRVTITGIPYGSNWFYIEPYAMTWKSSTVGFNSTSGPILRASLGIGLGIGIVAMYLYVDKQGGFDEAIRKWRKPLPPQKGGIHRSKKDYDRQHEKERRRREDQREDRWE